jgi:hypothetical protein
MRFLGNRVLTFTGARSSLDHLVGAGEQRCGDVEAKILPPDRIRGDLSYPSPNRRGATEELQR